MNGEERFAMVGGTSKLNTKATAKIMKVSVPTTVVSLVSVIRMI